MGKLKPSYIVTKNPQYFRNIKGFSDTAYQFCLKEDLPECNRLAIDTETTSLSARDGEMFCFQICTGDKNYLIDLQKYETELCYPEYQNITYKFEEFIPYLTDKFLIFQNAIFDLKFFYLKNFYPKQIGDTWILSKMIYNGYPPNFRHGLGDLFERELNIKIDKFEQANIAKVRLSQLSTINYSFLDVNELLELYDVLHNKMIDYELQLSYQINCNFALACAYMELCGLPLSTSLWKKKMIDDELRTATKGAEIIEYIYENLPQFRENQLSLFEAVRKIKPSLTSAKQMIPVFDALKIPILVEDKKNKGKKKKSIESDVVRRSKHEFVKIWLDYKSALHDCTTYGQNILNKVEKGRIYTSFNIILDTNRIASRGGAINFLNFPSTENTRQCFVANKGFKIVVSDYSGQENCTTASITGDYAMIESLQNNKCLHCAYARVIYPEITDLSDEEITKHHKDKRQNAKAPRFAFAFGGSAYTVSNNLNISFELATSYHEAYKKLHSGIFAWADIKVKEFIRQGFIQHPVTNFRLKLPFIDQYNELEKVVKNFSSDDWNLYRVGKDEWKEYYQYQEDLADKIDNLEKIERPNSHESKFYLRFKDKIGRYFSIKSSYYRLTLNSPAQGLAAHQTKLSTYLLFKEILKNGHQWRARICNQVHDEIVMEVVDELADYYALKVGEFMVEAGNSLLPNTLVQMQAEGKANDSWYSAK